MNRKILWSASGVFPRVPDLRVSVCINNIDNYIIYDIVQNNNIRFSTLLRPEFSTCLGLHSPTNGKLFNYLSSLITLYVLLTPWSYIALVFYRAPITVVSRSKAWTVFARSITGSWVRIPLEAWISVCVYSVFVGSCVQVAALRRADLPSKESYRLCEKIKKLKKRPRSNKGL
jgi:hypothetical protein